MDESSYNALKSSLSSVPAKALNYSCRQILTNNLDNKQVLPSKYGIARDYRGLAELMGFEYVVIKKFASSDDPTMKILETWETNPESTLDKLIGYLEEMERYDVIKEIIPLLEKNAEAYSRHQRLQETPIQVPEVTPGPISRHSVKGLLTGDDLRSGECTIYDAYVSYADEDCAYVNQFAKYLELEIGLKLFIRGRDMLAGCAELDTNIELIKNRCRHMLIILTPNFIKSPACEFQVSFAGSLAIEQKQRILIPVILAPCQIPLILNSVSKIDFTRPHIQDWMWEKLITSLLPEDNSSVFLSSLARSPIHRNSDPKSKCLPSASSNKPVITFPETTKLLANSVDKSNSVLAITSSDVPENESKELAASTKISPPPKKFQSLMAFLKGKNHSSSSSSSAFSTTSSGATSGFHSQSQNDIGNSENYDNFSSDTSL